jgi:hypothetical protein
MMNTLIGLPLQGLPAHALLVLVPLTALVLTSATFWLIARRMFAKAAHAAGVVHRPDDLLSPASLDAATAPAAESARPPVHRYG